MPLTIRRYAGEKFRITTPTGVIVVRLDKIEGRKAQLSVDAPREFDIVRLDAQGNVEGPKKPPP